MGFFLSVCLQKLSSFIRRHTCSFLVLSHIGGYRVLSRSDLISFENRMPPGSGFSVACFSAPETGGGKPLTDVGSWGKYLFCGVGMRGRGRALLKKRWPDSSWRDSQGGKETYFLGKEVA